MRILIIANGAPPSRKLVQKLHHYSDFLIAANGGAQTALGYGLRPDVITGDMDSFEPEISYSGKILPNKDQETNDLEKALRLAYTRNAQIVDVAGATGRRLDHTLKNLSVLQQFTPHFVRIAFFDDLLYTRILPGDFSIHLPPSHPVSLFPLSGRVDGIRTEGLKYTLHDEHLENGVRDGSSNQTLDGRIRIRHKSGTLLFMTPPVSLLFEL